MKAVSPATAGAGAGPLTLTVTGNNFTSASIVQVGTVAEPTTYVSATQLTATISAAQLASGALLPVTVLNGTTSSAGTVVNLEVDNPVPAITSFSPTSFVTTSAPAAVTVSGTGFVPTTTISVNGSPRSTTYVSATQVTVTLTVTDLANPAALSLTASNGSPGGGSSGAASIPVSLPLPTLTAVTPSIVTAGSTAAVPITLTGTNFVNGSVVLVGATAHSTTFVSATELTSALTVADVANVGTLSVTVANPAPSATVSNAVPVAVVAPVVPHLDSVSPNSLYVSTSIAQIDVYGTDLDNNCKVLWNGTALSTTYDGSQTYSPVLKATVPASLLSSPGTASISANCSSNFPAGSNVLPISVTLPPAPTFSTLAPAAAPIGKDVAIRVGGTNFLPGTIVQYNGVTLPSTYVSSYSITLTLPASLNLLPGVGSFQVITPAPGGGTTAALPFTSYIGLLNNDVIFNPTDGLFYASVPSSAGALYGNSIVSIDPSTGALGKPIRVGSEPDRLALTADGRYLWVGIDGANAVRKVDLVAGTAGLQFALPPQATNSVGDSTAYALAALPGATDSVIVSSADYPNYFAIYDSGKVRGNAVSGIYTQPYGIVADGSKSEIYASGYAGYQVFTYSSSGLTQKITNGFSAGLQYGQDMQIAGGKLYASDGKVYNPETGSLLGTLYVSGNTVASGSTFADPATGKIFVIDNPTGYPVFYGQGQIQIFNIDDLTSSTAIPISLEAPNLSSSKVGPNRLTRWGSNGLAFRTEAGLFSLRSNLVKDLSSVTADLGVTIASTGSTTSAPVTFIATVKNYGGSTATNVTLAAVLPANATLISASSTAGSCYTAATLNCDLGSLTSGSTTNVTIALQPSQAGNLPFAVQVSGSEADPLPANNTSSRTVAVTGSLYNPAPTLTAISPTAVRAGSTDTVLTVNGSGFNVNSVVRLAGNRLVTTFASSTQLSAVVPAANLDAMGWTPVTVTNGTPGGGISAPMPLTIFSVLNVALNHIGYEPFSRKIFASVGTSSGLASLPGNSIAELTPESGLFTTAIPVGSQPTRFSISDDGNYLYAILSGSNTVARVEIPANALEFTFSVPPVSSAYNTAPVADVAVQPGSDTVLAAMTSGVCLVDVNVATHSATVRGATTTGAYEFGTSGVFHFRDSSALFLTDYSLKQYPVTSSGLSASTPHTSLYLEPFNTFMISGNYAYADLGGLANVSGTTPVQAGTFTPLIGSTYNAKVAGDASLGRAFFSGAITGSIFADGIVAYDQATFLPSLALPLNLRETENNSFYNVVDLIRWGQDGLAMLTDSGHLYLLRGAAVVPGELTANAAATLTASSATTLTLGAGNTMLTLTGSNFLPGVAVHWNGSYRTTTIVDSTHLTVAIPASDLAAAGTGTLTAVNPGASASTGLAVTIQ